MRRHVCNLLSPLRSKIIGPFCGGPRKECRCSFKGLLFLSLPNYDPDATGIILKCSVDKQAVGKA
jgi:hypothetical protein